LQLAVLTYLIIFFSASSLHVHHQDDDQARSHRQTLKGSKRFLDSSNEKFLRRTVERVAIEDYHAGAFQVLDQLDPANQKSFYVQLQSDGTGANVQSMMMAHAYGFNNGATFLGGCVTEPDQTPRNLAEIKRMLEGIGLSEVLPLKCPTDATPVIKRAFFAWKDEVWTNPWLEFIRSKVNYDYRFPDTMPHPRNSAVVHMRRGDVGPCRSHEYYLPNSYYRSVIEKYVPTETPVLIFSQQHSVEPWDDFQPYQLRLDFDPLEAWKAMMNADLLIISKSSFSMVPAVLNRHGGTVVYTDFWHGALSGWKQVDAELQRHGKTSLTALQQKLCQT
jgi:hypothetical protein